MGYVKKKMLGLVVGLFIISTTFIFLSILNFYRVLEEKESEVQGESLYDLSQFTSDYMDVKLEGYLSTLYGLSDLMLLKNVEWSVVRERLNAIVRRQEFQHIGLSSLDGQVWATDGNKDFVIDISQRAYWPKLLEGQAIITDAQDSLVAANQIFVVAVPILNRENQVVGIVHGAVSLNEFQDYEASRFDLGTYLVFVVDRSGAFILRDYNHPESWAYETIFEELEAAGNRKDSSAIQKQLQTGMSIQTDVTIFGKEYFLCFSPLSLNKWYTVMLMPRDEINQHIEVLLDDNINILMVCVILPLIVLCIVFLYFLRREISIERNKEFQLREKLFSDIEGFIQTDLNDDKVMYCSQSLGLPDAAMPFSLLLDTFVHNTVEKEYQEKIIRMMSVDSLFEIYSKGVARVSQEFMVNDKKGRSKWFQCDVHMEQDFESNHVIVYFILRNIDEKKRMENALKTKAERDSLTGLYNRSTATDLINVFLHLNTYSPDVTHAFVILDLDNFKVLNDTLLHKTGDKALQDVAQILQNFFRKGDIVCRLGGDEFVVFLKNIKYKVLERKLDTLMKELQLTYSQDEKSVSISASAGIALSPLNGVAFRELYGAADQALYQAKHAGKATFRLFSTT